MFKDKKMEAAQVEAMLQEAHINWSVSRVLFHHLKQFFGASFFEAEHVRWSTFMGQEFAPISDVKTLPDKW